MTGFQFVIDLLHSAHQEQNLTNLTDQYVKALRENTNNQFNKSLPVLTALHIFDVTAIPNRSDLGFNHYEVEDVEFCLNTSSRESLGKQVKIFQLLLQNTM